MSNLSELLPSGGGQNVVSLTADGAITAGAPVVLNSDGTVAAISTSSISASVGAQVNAANVNSEDTAVIFDSATDKFTLFYADRNNSDYGTYVVGTISGTSITFGTPAVFNTAAVTNVDAVYDEASGNIVVVWSQSGTGGRAIVGSRSGDTITFGSAVTFDSNSVYGNGATYVEDAEKVFISYQRNSAGTGHGIVGTVSGTSISFGSAATMPSSVNPARPQPVYIGSSKAVVATRDINASPRAGKAVVATIDGTSVSFGSFTTFETQSYSGTGYQTDITYDSANDKVVIGYTDGGNNDYGTAIVGTVSGTSISFGTAVVFASTNIRYYYSPILRYSVKSGKVFTVYVDASESNIGKYILGTVSGTSISFGASTTFTTDEIAWLSLAVNDTNNKFAVGYKDDTAGGDPSAQIIQDGYTDTNLTSTNCIGIAAGAIANSAAGNINVFGGISTAHSGLTIGADYYVQDDGSLASDYAPFDISSASYASKSLDVSGEDTLPEGLAFNTDGTKLFAVGDQGNDINEYTLSTGFDVSTGSFVDSFSVGSEQTDPTGVAFNANGTKMFVVGQGPARVSEYALSTGFDVSTASHTRDTSISQDTNPKDIAFNTDGTSMYVVGTGNDKVYQYALSSGFDLSSVSFTRDLSVTAEDDSPQGITFVNSGSLMFITGVVGDKLIKYTLSTPFDISTASSDSEFSLSSQASSPNGVAFNTDGTTFFISDSGTDAIYQYNTSAASTTMKVGQAISATTINMRNLT